MQLYYSPLSCSAATRVCLYEAGTQATFIEVDSKAKRTLDGRDYLEVNPLGLVPALRTDDGDVLTENAAILQYLAGALPQAELAPTDHRGRVRLQQWLSFIGTELHKATFTPLLDASSPEGAKAYALGKGATRLAYLEKHLTGREFLLERFSVADAYLMTVLNWCAATPIDLKTWPAISAYFARLQKRPSVAKAFSEERALYVAQLEKRKTSP
ncbi:MULTISPECIES: glutathione S-transferase N-terminal domain-containing protein [unclassified Corallococcus]|uniref:glutathione S-transferase N-terminal domain-containing protein n=1 Tax=unclassified Corallococcus TaxID=2685029 RepID=UPI001A8CB935|nr:MULTISPECIES: glutathione S-transferase N-terminal domain-containing protein [unclassified Corallococcus]MBN9685943.1 glutathione S-transferase N-terminal domain-containing protein [Corallococcus sp. NCSPR001]WAS82617.1 glutathione S-transferase N-terminal domain-containing protein [Corallococcus sp. NCRR]